MYRQPFYFIEWEVLSLASRECGLPADSGRYSFIVIVPFATQL